MARRVTRLFPSIKARLLSNLIGLSLAILALALAGWIGLGSSFQSMRDLRDRRVVPLAELKLLSDRYAVDIVDTAHKVRGGALEAGAGLGIVTRARAAIEAAWGALVSLDPPVLDTADAATLRERMNGANAAVAELEALLSRGDAAGLERFVLERLYPAIDPVTALVARLVDGQIAGAEADLDSARAGFGLAIWTLTGLSVLGLAAMGWGMLIAVRGVSRPLTRLSAVMSRLAGRDLDVTIPYAGRDDEIGAMARALEVFRDEARAHVELTRSELVQRTILLRAALDAAPQALAVVDRGGRIRFMNRALAAMAGEAIGEGERLDGLLAALAVPLPATALLGPAASRAAEVRGARGQPLALRALSIETGDTLLSITDLSEQREAEAERLEQQQRMLQAEKSQALVTLAGSIAHDFNNLLAVIRGFSSLADDGLRQLAASEHLVAGDAAALRDAAGAIGKVIASAERGRHVVATLTALARDRRSEDVRCDLRTVVGDVEPLLRVLLPSSVSLDVGLAEHPCALLASPVQLEQIVTNLCINAVHAIDGRAGCIRLTVEPWEIAGGRAEGLRQTEAASHREGAHVEAGPDGSSDVLVGILEKGPHVRLTVCDDGSGMTPEVAQRIFKPFFTTKPADRGTGLGLSSVLAFVTSLRGAIHVQSRPGGGTVFAILLPQYRELGPAAGATSIEPAAGVDVVDAVRVDTRVLVIDDEPALADLMVWVLARAGYEVERFTDPVAAIRRFTDEPDGFDLIVTDHTMPGMTGLEVAAAAWAHRPAIPLVICTGHLPEMAREGALPAGVRAVVRKPFAPAELVDAARQALAAG